MVVIPDVTCGMILVECLTVFSGFGTRGPVVPDVTDVPVSPSSVVTELFDVSSFCSDREFVEPQFFSFTKKACTLLFSYAGSDEVRRLTSESASDNEKKNDAAQAAAEFE